ncbi:hypothetical protein C8Q78DRAFT_1080708 [Trametes maxima]|nr:hypothetical protein C8Q78DRAFT_1080708 [Trametes maxima]
MSAPTNFEEAVSGLPSAAASAIRRARGDVRVRHVLGNMPEGDAVRGDWMGWATVALEYLDDFANVGGDASQVEQFEDRIFAALRPHVPLSGTKCGWYLDMGIISQKQQLNITLSITIIIMVGTSYDLPPTVRSTIPQDLPDEQLRRCPVRLNGQDQHVFFWPEGLFPHHLRPVAVSEDVEAQDEWMDVAPCFQTSDALWHGSHVWSSIKKPVSFYGSSTPTLRRASLWQSPTHSMKGHGGGISDLCGSSDVSGQMRIGTVQASLFIRVLKIYDLSALVEVGSSPNIEWWELDDAIQGQFQYLYSDG